MAQEPAKTNGNPPAPTTNQWGNLSAGLIPVVPVSFTGKAAMIAWLRLILYGGATVMLWEKHRRIAYITGGAAGLSLATSMAVSISEGINGEH